MKILSKNIHIFYITFSLFNISFLYAQPEIAWQRTFGGVYIDDGSDIIQTRDGGFMITGFISTATTNNEIFFIKTDSLGNEQWSNTFGGDSYEWGTSVRQITDDGYIVFGSTMSFGSGNFDACLVKLDSKGNVCWHSTYGDTMWELCRDGLVSSDGCYVITGEYGANDFGYGPLMLAKLDTMGNLLWDKTYEYGYYNEGYSIKQTTDGGYIIVGGTDNDLWLLKTDSLGDTLWTKIYGGSAYDCGFSVEQVQDSGYIMTGYYETEIFQRDVWILKTDQHGEIQWSKTFGTDSYDEEGYSIAKTSDGGFIVAGYVQSNSSGSDCWIIKIDATGNKQWDMSIGGEKDDWVSAIQQTSDGGYIIVGTTESYGKGDGDIFLVKLNPEDGSTSIKTNRATVPDEIQLSANYPNPFNAITKLSYYLPNRTKVEVKVYSVLGQLVETLVSEQKNPGLYFVEWDTNGYSSGIYLIRLATEGIIKTRKCTLLK